MERAEPQALRDWLEQAPRSSARALWSAEAGASLDDLASGSSFGGRLPELCGRSVFLATRSQLTTALALIELDGLARRIVLCPSDLDPAHAPAVIAGADVDAIVSDHDAIEHAALAVPMRVACGSTITRTDRMASDRVATEWVLLTSGTTGMPKLVKHTLASLTAAIRARKPSGMPVVWGTFYDMRRYGGLQIFLRAVLGGASFVLSSAGEPVADHLHRLGRHGVTHLSGTPSHWRRALMSPAARAIAPRYVRLSGEIADQAILDNLRAFFPGADVGHAYASTEAGVGFEVDDGLAGFPASMIGPVRNGVEMKIVDDSLRIRSPGAAAHYVGAQNFALADDDGFVDTGDIVELRGERYYFVGRRGGIINVGGLKVHPEEIEAVINRHPDVRMSLVRPRKNPITGAIVVADVVLMAQAEGADADARLSEVRSEILQLCRAGLAPHKIPAAISFVPTLAVAATGKLARRYA